MSDGGSDRAVNDYLQRLKSALVKLPSPIASQVLEDVTVHIEDARAELGADSEAATRDILDRLGEPEEIAAAAAAATGSGRNGRSAHRRRRRSLVIAAGAAALVAVSVALVVALPGERSSEPRRASLLSHLPNSTEPILLATGRAGGLAWTFWAKMNPVDDVPGTLTTTPASNPMIGPMLEQPGLSTAIVFDRNGTSGAGGGSGPSGDPGKLARSTSAPSDRGAG